MLLKWYALEIDNFHLSSSETALELQKTYSEYFIPWLGVYGYEYFNVLPGYIFVKFDTKPKIREKGYGESVIECTEEDVQKLKDKYLECLTYINCIGNFLIRIPEGFDGIKVKFFGRHADIFCMLAQLESQTRFFIGNCEDFLKLGE